MREMRTYGSEEGATRKRSFLPLSNAYCDSINYSRLGNFLRVTLEDRRVGRCGGREKLRRVSYASDTPELS
jgi:hypothetical protein